MSNASQRSTAYHIWLLQTQRMRYLTRLGCRIEFTWNATIHWTNGEQGALQCTLTPPAEITSSQFAGMGMTIDAALGAAYQIAMEAGVFDPMTVEGT